MIKVTGKMREAVIYDENLMLTREIKCVYGTEENIHQRHCGKRRIQRISVHDNVPCQSAVSDSQRELKAVFVRTKRGATAAGMGGGLQQDGKAGSRIPDTRHSCIRCQRTGTGYITR